MRFPYLQFEGRHLPIIHIKVKGKKEFVKIGDGSFMEIYSFKLRVILADKEFDAKIGFSRSLGIGFNILGRLDIFEKFRVCFDETKKIIEFDPK